MNLRQHIDDTKAIPHAREFEHEGYNLGFDEV